MSETLRLLVETKAADKEPSANGKRLPHSTRVASPLVLLLPFVRLCRFALLCNGDDYEGRQQPERGFSIAAAISGKLEPENLESWRASLAVSQWSCLAD